MGERREIERREVRNTVLQLRRIRKIAFGLEAGG